MGVIENVKKLYLLRGCPGCGKSTLISQVGAEEYTISTDALRLKLAGTEIVNGVEVISQKKNGIVFKIVLSSMESKMKSGLPVILDATNLSRVGKYYTLASEYGYEVVVVDFKVSLDVLKERNLHRGIANVPVDVVEKMYEKKRTTEIHSGSRVISPTDFKREWREVVSQISKN